MARRDVRGRDGASRRWWRGALCAAVLAGCAGPDAEPGAGAYGGTAVVAGVSDLEFANALVAGDVMTQEVNRFLLFLPLLAYDAGLAYEPRLAASWRLTGDTGAVFHLRRDVRWHDGRPTTAYDVAFTFRRLKDPATAFPNASYFEHWTDVVVEDSFTVRFTMEPHADPLAGWALFPVMPSHLLDTVPPEAMRRTPFNKSPVGNGPFRFISQRPNDRWVFAANVDFPDALGGRPHLDRLVWRVIPERQAQITELLAGEADLVLNPPAEQFDSLAARPELRGLVRPTRKYVFIGWNGRVPPFDDARVRRAMTQAIDRDAMLAAFRQGRGTVAVGPLDPDHWAFHEGLTPIAYDPDRARALLAGAGYRDRDGDGVLERPDGSPFRFHLLIPAGSDFSRNVAEVIQSDLAEVGVEARLRILEWGTLVADISSPERRFEAVVMGWEGDLRPNLRDLFHSEALDGPFQLASYADEEADRLLERVSREVDRDAARPLWFRIQEILQRDQPWTFLYYYPDLALVRNRLRGVEMDVRGVLVNAPDWRVVP